MGDSKHEGEARQADVDALRAALRNTIGRHKRLMTTDGMDEKDIIRIVRDAMQLELDDITREMPISLSDIADSIITMDWILNPTHPPDPIFKQTTVVSRDDLWPPDSRSTPEATYPVPPDAKGPSTLFAPPPPARRY